MVEQYEQSWAEEMAQLLLDIKTEVEQLPADQLALSTNHLEAYSQQYDKLIDRGLATNPQPSQPASKRGRKKQTPPKNLLDRLQKYKPETLAFMYDRQVPFDNNGSSGTPVIHMICRGWPCARPRLGDHKGTPLPQKITRIPREPQ